MCDIRRSLHISVSSWSAIRNVPSKSYFYDPTSILVIGASCNPASRINCKRSIVTAFKNGTEKQCHKVRHRTRIHIGSGWYNRNRVWWGFWYDILYCFANQIVKLNWSFMGYQRPMIFGKTVAFVSTSVAFGGSRYDENVKSVARILVRIFTGSGKLFRGIWKVFVWVTVTRPKLRTN